jgi:hypothetical protein
MANLCDNRLTVQGDPKLVESFASKNRGEIDLHDQTFSELAFSALVPEPEHKRESSYNWRIDNWGTRRQVRVYNFDALEASLTYDFFSDWMPPIEWLAHVAPQFPALEFELIYYETGEMIFGKVTAVDGEISSTHGSGVQELLEFVLTERPDDYEDLAEHLEDYWD